MYERVSVLSALAFILLGSFIDWGQNRFLSGLRRPSVRKTQIKSDSDRLIYKKNSFLPYMTVHSLLDRPVESQWTVNFDARAFTLNLTPLVHNSTTV